MADPKPKREEQRFDFEKDLPRMQKLLEVLKLQYNLYFSGARKDPPVKERAEMDRLFAYYRNATISNLTQSFRFNSFAHTYTLQCEQWGKWQRAKDNGVVADPRMVAALRKAQQELDTLEKETPEEARQHRDEEQAEAPAAPARPAAKPPVPGAHVHLFDEYLKARQANGEATNVDQGAFERQIASQREAILEKYKAKDVIFSVVTQNGKVTLKAKVVK